MAEDQQLQQQEQEPQQQQQQQQSQQELAKLRAIDAKVKQVQDKLTSRLPHQRSHLAAMVCGTTWVNRVRLVRQQSQSIAASQEQYEQIVKKVRMELGAFDYQVKEQGELLTRYLCELDNILSFGNAEVKDARKALVVFIQSLLTTADEFRTKSAKLKEFGNKLMSTLPKSETQHAITEDAADDASEAQTPASPLSEAEDVDMKPLFADEDDEEEENEEEDEEDEDAGQEEDDEESDQEMDDGADDMESEDEEQEDVQDVQAQTAPGKSYNSPRQSQSQTQQQKPTIDTRSLPVWRPYYQIQRRRDGLYLVANLRDVNPQNVRVQWNECTNVLHVSGHKLPNQKDIMVSRFSGVPTFGRFEITERLPANMLNMDEATQKVREDGTLEIRMPYYYCMVQQQQQRQPRLFSRRGSLFDAPRCMVW